MSEPKESIIYVGDPGTCETCIFSDVDCRDYGKFDCQEETNDTSSLR